MIRIQLSQRDRSSLEHAFRNAADRKLHDRIQIVFVAGRNRPLGIRAARLAAPFPKAALDWCEDMAALLDVADATFTKAGGFSAPQT